MSRYGLFAYGQGLYGQSGNDGLYDARPIFAYSFPKSYKDADDPAVTPYLPSDYSPAAVDPDNEDYPDMFWGPSYFSQYLTDFYEQNYGQVFIEPELGSEFFYILLTWARPAGDWTDLAVVKRKFGPPETVDDGTTMLTISSGTLRNEYVEALPQGESVYYGIFVRTTIGEWKSCGYAEAVNARNHDGLEEFFKAIPRVYTSATGGMVDVIDRRGQLSRFLQGLAFEYDYWKTQTDRLAHDPGRMPWSAVASWSKQLGMSDLDLVTVGDRNLRRWLTSASSYSETKGTQNGIEAMASAITGWPVTATVSPNLMLDTDDSSAENGLGRWVATSGVLDRVVIGGGVTSPANGGSPITNSLSGSPHLQGYVFTFAPSGATASLSLGNSNPINHGIPVTAGTTYKFNICWKATVTTTGNLKADITWYDIRGASISTTSGTNQAASASWQQTTTTSAAAPAGAAYAGITLSFSSITGSPVYHLDMGQFVENATDIAGKFYDARAIDLNVSPIRTNYCTNPSFETNTSGWYVAASGDTYSPVVLADTPQAYYRTNATTDSSGNSHTITAQGTVNSVSGIVPYATGNNAFQGTVMNRKVATGTWMDSNTISMEAWFKTTAGGTIIARGWFTAVAIKHWILEVNTTTGFLRLGTANGTSTFTYLAGATDVRDNNLHHVVATIDHTTKARNIYLDGVLHASDIAANALAPTANDLIIGATYDTSPTFAAQFNGTLDEVAYYTTTLSLSRVQAHYNAGIAPPAPTQGAANSGYAPGGVTNLAASLSYTDIASGAYTSTAVGTFSAGDPVTASIYLKATSGTGAASVTIPIKVECKNSGGTVLSTDTTSATVVPGSYQRISVTRMIAPANTSYVTVTVAGSGTSASMTGVGSSLLIDGCLIEKRESLLSYFDAGVYSDTGASKWAGTAHASISYLYPLRLSRQSSLTRIMADYVPEPVYTRVVLA